MITITKLKPIVLRASEVRELAEKWHVSSDGV